MGGQFQIVKCKHPRCGVDMVFVMTEKGHQMPVDLASLKCAGCNHTYGGHAKGYCGEGTPNPADGKVCECPGFRMAQLFDAGLMVSHFGTCVEATRFRKRRKE